MHANPGDEPVVGEIRLPSLTSSRSGVQMPLIRTEEEPDSVDHVVAWNWRTRTAEPLARTATIPVSLGQEEWAFYVLAPILPSGLAVIGDITKFATAGDARVEVFRTSTGVRLVVKGGGENVTITGWAEAAPTSADGIVEHSTTTGVWSVSVAVPSRGWIPIRVDVPTLPASASPHDDRR